MSAPIRITAIENGPFKMSGVESLSYCGETQQAKETVFLCRCGESKNAPFCDGTHKADGFDSTPSADTQGEQRIWQGKRISTRFNTEVCIHAYDCKPLKALREQEPNDESDATARRIAEVVRACPSGALSYQFAESIDDATDTVKASVTIAAGGEIRVVGGAECENFNLQAGQTGDRLTLCRCGLSKNKPYCDFSHRKKDGFR
ncbi:CDGSH iron-sulfur domain-containing protein [Gammaproteobacteria bacterium]|nr:CDGSH iron-sulfur domain-containing protein [Gammaproteobacteria bacterium]